MDMDVTRNGDYLALAYYRFHAPILLDVREYHRNELSRATALSEHPHRIFAVAFSRDGKTLAAAGTRGAISFWDVHTGEKMLMKSLNEHMDTPGKNYEKICLEFAPDDSALVCGLTPAITDGETKPRGILFTLHAPRVDRQPSSTHESEFQTASEQL